MNQPWFIVVLLGLVVFVFSFIQSRKRKIGTDKTETLRELEETFEHFAKEIEEDNRKVTEHVSILKGQLEQEIKSLQDKVNHLEQQADMRTTADLSKIIVKKVRRNDADAIPSSNALSPVELSAAEDKANELSIASRYQHVFDLYEQGKSTEYIARKTGMNKGEVQLIITLSRQEEAARAQK